MKSFAVVLHSLAFVSAGYAQTNLWQNSGNIGIGTTSPSASFHVDKLSTGDNAQLAIFNKSGEGYGSAYISVGDGGYWTSLETNSGGSGPFRFGSTYADSLFSNSYQGSEPYGSLQFATGSAARMTIIGGTGPTSGYVGVGTTNPIRKVQIQGMAGSGSLSPQEDLLFVGGNELGGVGGFSGIQLGGATNGRYGNYIRSVKTLSYGNYWNTDLTFSVTRNNTGNLVDEILRIASTGNVGIGTVNPSGKLTIAGAAGDIRSVTIDSSEIKFRGDGIAHISILGPTTGKPYLSIGQTSSYFAPGSSSTEALVVTSSSNVGIGTTSPSEKLSVNGRIRAKEVIVDTNWSDYVFAKDYKLASLSEVEQHIQQQGHLPGVPSAAEVAEKGVSVGDMQALLLAKLEEVTLHLIAQEKNQNAQEKRLNEATAKLETQAAKIATLEAENAQLKQ